MRLSVSVHGASGMLAVGWGEPGAVLPSAVRVLDFELGELVADGVAAWLAERPHGHPGDPADLDAIVAAAEATLARRVARASVPRWWARCGLLERSRVSRVPRIGHPR